MRLRFLTLVASGAALLASTLAAAAPTPARHDLADDCPAAATGLVEHFIGADCFDCWKAGTPAAGAARVPGAEPAGPHEWSLDWIVPAADDASMAPSALPESADRLARIDANLAARLQVQPAALDLTTPLAGNPPGHRFYVHSGLPHLDYIGVQLHAQGVWPAGSTAWVGLVERLPVGTRDTPIARHLVRVLVGPVALPQTAGPEGETKPAWAMRWPLNSHTERLIGVAWVEDAHGRITQITSERCLDPK